MLAYSHVILIVLTQLNNINNELIQIQSSTLIGKLIIYSVSSYNKGVLFLYW